MMPQGVSLGCGFDRQCYFVWMASALFSALEQKSNNSYLAKNKKCNKVAKGRLVGFS